MADYQLISEDEKEKVFIVSPSGILESLKLAWYVVRYPARVPVLMVVPKSWCDEYLENP
ncbi:hypothetical protein HAQ01_04795 [Acidithiobacillus thiooxidans]|uniref:hypothetical protein n=1 Tax=Acidithiobacillus thiooxidans TaxID=930 RepID=UPI001C07EAF5|nr:hypothetical protein [Acidithiobacillus thiooxidans]MBU2792739.1 hypothetical protein [Acidithiobacillus thiooxidans]